MGESQIQNSIAKDRYIKVKSMKRTNPHFGICIEIIVLGVLPIPKSFAKQNYA